MRGLVSLSDSRNLTYGNSDAVPAKSPGSPRVLLRPGRRGDLADGSIRACTEIAERAR